MGPKATPALTELMNALADSTAFVRARAADVLGGVDRGSARPSASSPQTKTT